MLKFRRHIALVLLMYNFWTFLLYLTSLINHLLYGQNYCLSHHRLTRGVYLSISPRIETEELRLT